LVNLIEQKYLSKEGLYRPVDFARISQYFTLDVITAVAFGKPFGYLTTDSDVHEYIRVSEEALHFMLYVSMVPTLVKILQSRLFKWFAPSEGDKLGVGRVMGFVMRILVERTFY
jgi:hypothetical protein